MAKEIKVRLHMPETAEGMAALAQRMTEANSGMLADLLNNSGASWAQKQEYLQSLNGRVPWAGREHT